MKEKERFFAPETEVLEMESQGVICQSITVSAVTITDPFAGNTEDTWTE